VAQGYEVTGTICNLSDGRVEMIAEGEKAELEQFCSGIREAGLGRLIRNEETSWKPAKNEFRGFDIVR
jgi:acylphosphatase